MIPRIIHYFWFGHNPLPAEVVQCIESWKKFWPDYEIRCWDESNFDVSQNPYCQEAYEAKKWAFVSDYARLKVLYDYGGIYMDTDEEVVKNLDLLLKYRAFIGFESASDISAGMIGCCPRNEWIGTLLHDYVDRHFKRGQQSYDLTTIVQRITQITQEMYSVRLDGTLQVFGNHMILLPVEYLCAKSYITGDIFCTENTFGIQHFNGSWLSEEDKRYMEKVHNYQRKHPEMYRHRLGKLLMKTAAAYKTGGGADGYPKDKENIELSQWMCKGTQSLPQKSQQSEYPVSWGHTRSCGREAV